MDHITVLRCTNISGKDKVKLLIIDKSKKPPCFKDIYMDTMPVTYRGSQNAYMTSVLFEERITTWDAALRKQGCKILVLVDSCSAYPQNISTLTNIWLEFLYANSRSLIHPISTQDSLISPSAEANNVSYKMLLLDAMLFVNRSW